MASWIAGGGTMGWGTGPRNPPAPPATPGPLTSPPPKAGPLICAPSPGAGGRLKMGTPWGLVLTAPAGPVVAALNLERVLLTVGAPPCLPCIPPSINALMCSTAPSVNEYRNVHCMAYMLEQQWFYIQFITLITFTGPNIFEM